MSNKNPKPTPEKDDEYYRDLDDLLAGLPHAVSDGQPDPLSEICDPCLVNIDLSGGFVLDEEPDSAIPDEYDQLLDEVMSETGIPITPSPEHAPRVFCVRHTDPAFSNKTWCGKAVAGTPTFSSTDDAIYIMSENVSFKYESDAVCPSCIATIRRVLGPGQKHHEGDFVTWHANTEFSMN